MKFIIEQIALCPIDPERARTLLEEIGAHEWHLDHVVAHGEVFGIHGRSEADLAFNYQMTSPKPLELELLHYTDGNNWMREPGRHNSVSHLGMHCREDQLQTWITFFGVRGIRPAQWVTTVSHTNPVIAGLRRYSYIIFDTKHILGVDLKFIARHNQDGSPYDAGADL